MTDRLIIRDEGTLCLIRGADAGAQEALDAGAPDDATLWGEWIVVEPRYVEGVAAFVEEYLNEEEE